MKNSKQQIILTRSENEEENPGVVADVTGTTVDSTKIDASTVFVDAAGDYSTAASFKEWTQKKTSRSMAQAAGVAEYISSDNESDKSTIFTDLKTNYGSAAAMQNVTISVPYSKAVIDNVINYPDIDPEDIDYTEQVIADMNSMHVKMEDLNDAVYDDNDITIVQGVVDSAFIDIDDLKATIDLEESEDSATEKQVDVYVTQPITGSAGVAKTSVDNVVDGLSSAVQSADAINSMASSILEDFQNQIEDSSTFVSRFMDNVTVKSLDASSIAMSLIESVRSDIQSPNLSVKEKVKSVMANCGLLKDNTNEENVLEPYTDGFSGMSGQSPAALFGDKIVSAFETVDWSSIGEGVKTTWNAICKATSTAFSGLSEGLGKLFHKIKASTVAADDIYVVDKKGDPVINNVGWNFKMPDTVYSTYEKYLSSNEYTIFSGPTFKIYFWKTDSEIRGLIKFGCQYNDDVAGNFEDAMSFLQNNYADGHGYWSPTGINKVAVAYENNTTQYHDPETDLQAWKGIVNAKTDLAAWGTMLILMAHSPLLARTFTSLSTTTAQVISAMETAINAADYWFDIFDLTNVYKFSNLNNPSNSELAQEASWFGSAASATPYTVDLTVNAGTGGKLYTLDTFIACLTDVLLRYTASDWKYTQSSRPFDLSDYVYVPYLPYYHSTSSLDGRYALKTDSDNAKSYTKLLCGFVIASAAILIGATVLKRKFTSRKRAFALERQINHDKYHIEESLGSSSVDQQYYFGAAGITDVHLDPETGVPNDPKQVNKMLNFWNKKVRKQERKLSRIQKLMGTNPVSGSVNLLQNKVANDSQTVTMDISTLIFLMNGQREY